MHRTVICEEQRSIIFLRNSHRKRIPNFNTGYAKLACQVSFESIVSENAENSNTGGKRDPKIRVDSLGLSIMV